jgi:hypothetical protein
MPWEQAECDTEAKDIFPDGAASDGAPTPVGIGRRRVMVAAGFTVAVAGGSLAAVRWLTSARDGVAATPDPLRFRPFASASPAEVLNDLAHRAARQPTPAGRGTVLYTARQIWTFATGNDADGSYHWGMIGSLQETWLTSDGTGRHLTVQHSPRGDSPLTMDSPLPFPSAPPEAQQPNTDATRTWMLQQAQNWNTANWFAAERRWQRLADPAVTAQYLSILATQPDITVNGHTTTRGGHPAVAVSTMDNKPGNQFPETRAYLLLDPVTGRLVATETVALTVNAEAVGTTIATPMTIGYSEWQEVAHVPDMNTRP